MNGDAMPVIRAPEDSDVEMETQDDLHGTACNGNNKNGSSNGYQNGNGHTNNICEDGYEHEDDEMGKFMWTFKFC